MTLNGKVVHCVLSLRALFFFLSLVTPQFEWCAAGAKGDNRYLGITCDAWLQSAAQFLGGLATMVAVIWTIDHGRATEAQKKNDQLVAIGFELYGAVVSASSSRAVLLGYVNDLNSIHDPVERATGARVTLHALLIHHHRVYEGNTAAVAGMKRQRAARIVGAIQSLDRWNTLLGAARTDPHPELMLGPLIRMAATTTKDCAAALTALSEETGEKPSRRRPLSRAKTSPTLNRR